MVKIYRLTLQEVIFIVLAAVVLSFGAAEVYERCFIREERVTPNPSADLQKGLKEASFNDEQGTYSFDGRVESIEESVATIVTLDSRLVVRLNQLPLYQTQVVEFDPADLPSAQISDFAPGSEVVIVYNYLGYPEKVVLIKQ